jgi:mannose-6-phosphate isomerase-like protein (cupin superfamily)
MMRVKVVKLSNTKGKKILRRGEESLNFSSRLVVLKSGESVGEHKTENVEEVIVILHGTAEILINGKKYKTVKAPSVVYIPPNVVHDVLNPGGGVLKYIYITSKI